MISTREGRGGRLEGRSRGRQIWAQMEIPPAYLPPRSKLGGSLESLSHSLSPHIVPCRLGLALREGGRERQSLIFRSNLGGEIGFISRSRAAAAQYRNRLCDRSRVRETTASGEGRREAGKASPISARRIGSGEWWMGGWMDGCDTATGEGGGCDRETKRSNKEARMER